MGISPMIAIAQEYSSSGVQTFCLVFFQEFYIPSKIGKKVCRSAGIILPGCEQSCRISPDVFLENFSAQNNPERRSGCSGLRWVALGAGISTEKRLYQSCSWRKPSCRTERNTGFASTLDRDGRKNRPWVGGRICTRIPWFCRTSVEFRPFNPPCSTTICQK